MLIGKQHVQKVPQWYGETVGFWDGTTLVAWTANIQAWTQHTMFENSGKLEAVETFKPVYDEHGKFIGLDNEAVFYDPEALEQPVRIKDRFLRKATAGRPDRALHVHRVSFQRAQCQRPAQATEQERSGLRGLLRPALGAGVGEVFRAGLG